jgi:hypothetical protein
MCAIFPFRDVVALLNSGMTEAPFLRHSSDEHIGFGSRMHIDPFAAGRRLDTEPSSRFRQVSKKHLSFAITVFLRVEREKEFRRKLPEAKSAAVVGREQVENLGTWLAECRAVQQRLWNVEDVLQAPTVDDGVIPAFITLGQRHIHVMDDRSTFIAREIDGVNSGSAEPVQQEVVAVRVVFVFMSRCQGVPEARLRDIQPSSANRHRLTKVFEVLRISRKVKFMWSYAHHLTINFCSPQTWV